MFDATAQEAGDLFYTDFYLWEHSSGSQDVSCEEYHIPGHVQEHIDYVTPGVRLRAKAKHTKRSVEHGPRLDFEIGGPFEINSSTCGEYIVAECVRGSPALLG